MTDRETGETGRSQRGFRFIVRGETTIMDGDGRPIGRLHPGNTYVAIEITDDYVVIKSPTKGKAFVEVESVEMMDDPESDAAVGDASREAMPAPATRMQSAPAQPRVQAPLAETARPALDVPLWKRPFVLLGGVALVALAVIGTLVATGGSDDDGVGDPAVETVADEPSSSDEDRDASASDDASLDDQGAENASADAPVAPLDPSPTEAPEPTEVPAPTPQPEPTERPEPAAVEDEEQTGQAAGASDPAGPVLAGGDIVVSNGSLANKVFTSTPRGDQTNASVFPSPGPSSPPSLVWSTTDPLSSDPVLVPGAVIAGFEDRTIRALDTRTGAELWRTQLEIFRTNDLWVASDTVVAATGPTFTLFDVATGEFLGTIEAPSEDVGRAHSAMLLGGVFVGVWTESVPGDVSANVVAFDAGSGERLWETTTRGENFPPPMSFARGKVIYGHGTELMAFDLRTGAIAWTHEVERLLPLVITAVDDRVLIRDSALRALSVETGEVLWVGSDATGIHFPVDRGRVLAPATEPGVIDITNGARRSAGRVPDGLFGRSNAVAAQGIGYVQLSEGNIVAIDLETAQQLWTVDVSDNEFAPLAPMLAGEGLLFVLEEDDQLIAVG